MKRKIKIKSSDISFEESSGCTDFNNYYSSVEDIESDFNIEFSCGDGLYIQDLFESWHKELVRTVEECNLDRSIMFTDFIDRVEEPYRSSLLSASNIIDVYDGKVDFALLRDKKTGEEYRNCYLSFTYDDSHIIHLEHDRYSNFKIERR